LILILFFLILSQFYLTVVLFNKEKRVEQERKGTMIYDDHHARVTWHMMCRRGVSLATTHGRRASANHDG